VAFAAKILADSIAPSGKRLTTFEASYPRCIHSEIMTHRLLSKNAASSRAIPSEKLIQRVIDDPFVPIYWGKNQKGMQAEQELTKGEQNGARDTWLNARNSALTYARNLLAIGLHKQIVNRLIEPWMWITIIVSATEWSNFFGLRCHKDAEPHFQKIAGMMRDLYEASKPRELQQGEWHLPLWGFDGDEEEAKTLMPSAFLDSQTDPSGCTNAIACMVAVGRCARVSYLTHEGKRDLKEDIALHDRLMNANPGHFSPFEHVARAETEPALRSGNYWGFTQYRKLFVENEHIGGRMP
jgi:thymidylate synthase ThyX